MSPRFRSRLRPRQSAALRDAGRALRPAFAGRARSGARGDGGGGRCCAPTSLALLDSGSCGATRCARFASSAQTRRRKSEVRSALRAPTPRRRCSAPPKSPRAPERARPANAGRSARPASRSAADCRYSRVSGVRGDDGASSRERHDGTCKGAGEGAGRAPRARLVRCREAQQHRRRAQRASFVILAASVRAELAQRAQRVSPRQPVLRASQGTPAKRGQAPGAAAAHGPRVCPRVWPRLCPCLCSRRCPPAARLT